MEKSYHKLFWLDPLQPRSVQRLLSPRTTTPTYHPYFLTYRSKDLNIALAKVPLPIQVTNLNALSSDHNPILLEIQGTPITSLSPSQTRIINWNIYSDTLANLPVNVNLSANTESEIDNTSVFHQHNQHGYPQQLPHPAKEKTTLMFFQKKTNSLTQT